jgi:hypothetical protein
MPATELGLLIQIRDDTAKMCFWIQQLFWLAFFLLIIGLFISFILFVVVDRLF